MNFVSCTSSQNIKENANPIEKAQNRDRSGYVIPDSIFSFFPDFSSNFKGFELIVMTENALKSEFPLILSEFDPVKIVETYQCNTENSQILENQYYKQALFTISSQDSNYFVIGSERELLKRYDSLRLKEKYFRNSKPAIIFYFNEVFNKKQHPFTGDTSTICGLPKDFEILVLKSGNEYVLPQDHFYDWSILPKGLRHGYRSGVAFKKRGTYIIYWVVAW